MRMEILGPKRKQVTRGWRQFYSEDHPAIACQIKHNRGDEIKEDEFGTACGTCGTKLINGFHETT